MGAFNWHTLCNVRIGFPAIGCHPQDLTYRLHVGVVVRHGCGTFVRNIEGRRTVTLGSAIRVRKYEYNQGMACYRFDGTLLLPLPSHCRVVCLDVRKIRWCSFNRVAFHSFVWPRNIREAKGIVRTLCANRCEWTDMLVVRRRCFSICKRGVRCCLANQAFECLLWSWSEARRSWLLYREGNGYPIFNAYGTHRNWCDICWGDPVPSWLDECHCRCDSYCQCNLLGCRGIVIHVNFTKFYSDLWRANRPGDRFPDRWGNWYRFDGESVANACGCSRMMCHHPCEHCSKHTINDRIAKELATMAINALAGLVVPVPPPPPPPH